MAGIDSGAAGMVFDAALTGFKLEIPLSLEFQMPFSPVAPSPVLVCGCGLWRNSRPCVPAGKNGRLSGPCSAAVEVS